MSLAVAAPGAPRPALRDLVARVAEALRDHPEDALLAAARAAAIELPFAAATGPGLLAAVADPEDLVAPHAIRVLAGVDAARALPLALELLAASEPDPAYDEALCAELAKRSPRLIEAARDKGLLAWEPSADAPAHRWTTRPLAEAFPTPEALLAALEASPVDGIGLLQRDLLWSTIALESGAGSGWDPSSTPDARMPARTESPFRAPAARVVAAAFNEGRVPLATVTAAARRGWLSVGWTLETLRARKDLKPAERIVEALEGSVGPIKYLGEVAHAAELTQWLIGLAKKKPAKGAVPVLGYLWRAQDRLLRDEAGEALTTLRTPEAQRALAGALPEVLDGDWASSHWPARLAVRAAIALDPARATETLGAYFTKEALTTDPGRERARRILVNRAGSGPKERSFEEDPRWLDLAAGLLDGPLFDVAREFLGTFAEAAAQAAIDRAGYRRPEAGAKRAHTPPERPRWLERYEKGEHAEVWAEIAALEDTARDPAVVDEATAVARAMMKRVRTRLERVVKALKKHKYVFDTESTVKGIAPPAAEVGEQLAAIEAMIGGPLPLSLRAFYEIVGSVDLGEQHDAGGDGLFRGFGAYDPLMIVPPAMTLDFLKPHADHELRFPEALRRPPSRLFLGLDPRTKAEPTEPNDRPYRIEVQGEAADGLVRQGDRALPFVDYLRATLRVGGFPGLDAAEGDVGIQRDLLTKDLLPF